MAIDYTPVMLALAHPYPELEQWLAERFEALNGRCVRRVHFDDLPAAAKRVQPQYVKAWLWDFVPSTTTHVLFLDFDVLPVRALPDLPDAPFVAAPDMQGFAERRALEYPTIADCGYFNAGFFVARRDTRPIFEQLKCFAVAQDSQDRTHGEFEQTTLNLLVQAGVGVTWLPYECNVIAISDNSEAARTAINMHMCGMSSTPARWVILNALRSILGVRTLNG